MRATDAAGNVGTDDTTGELVIEGPPIPFHLTADFQDGVLPAPDYGPGLVAGAKGRIQAEIAADRMIRDDFGADRGRSDRKRPLVDTVARLKELGIEYQLHRASETPPRNRKKCQNNLAQMFDIRRNSIYTNARAGQFRPSPRIGIPISLSVCSAATRGSSPAAF